MLKFTVKSAFVSLSLLTLSFLSPLNPMAASEELLTETTWQLVAWGSSQSPEKPLDQTQITLRFGDNQINGSSGCNRYLASYELAENQLKIASAKSTRMACKAEIMRQESQYLSALQSSQSYEINPQGQLQIYYNSNRQSGVLTFEQSP